MGSSRYRATSRSEVALYTGYCGVSNARSREGGKTGVCTLVRASPSHSLNSAPARGRPNVWSWSSLSLSVLSVLSVLNWCYRAGSYDIGPIPWWRRGGDFSSLVFINLSHSTSHKVHDQWSVCVRVRPRDQIAPPKGK
jgi:hypothetical protein